MELASGWVILLPKTLWVCHAKNFRPIVCGEVFAKLAAKLATDRVVHHWTVPACCFGSVSGKGLPEALYIAKHAAQSSAALPNGALFVQLDLSQAFDSLFVNAILSFLQDHWLASTASSASLLRWVLLHSRLRFELFDFVWWCDQRRGTQQGGSHSPTLFGRLVAARFEQLTQTWQLQGEHPAFVAATLSLWALWFIEDAILVFQTVVQALRLLPQVVSMLAGLGLSINVAKSCILGCSLSCALPGCLAAFPVVATSKYLGLPFQVTGEDDHMVDQLCNRATAAFFSNRPILTNRLATRQHKLRLFNALVTASLRWSLCVLSVRQHVLRRLRVHCVTLLTWLLGGRAHPSWFTVECLQALRHGVKLWGRAYSELWDTLLVRMVWQWIGHVLRMPPSSLTRSVLLDLRPSSGQRRSRTGPDNSGHRSVIRYLQHQGLELHVAEDRSQWKDLETSWLRHNGVPPVPDSQANIFPLPGDKYMWTRRCLQGSFHGQQVLVCDVTHPLERCFLELDRVNGWRKQSYCGNGLAALFQSLLSSEWLWRSTFHLRVLLFQTSPEQTHVDALLRETPMFFEPFHLCRIVAEVSLLPMAWSGAMKQLATTLAG